MDVIFLAYENDADSQKWRSEKEEKFLNDNKDITETINKIRGNKPVVLNKFDEEYSAAKDDQTRADVLKRKQEYVDKDVKRYYKELHEAKKTRQEKWINELMKDVASYFDQAIKDLEDTTGKIIVAALPEFFWVDINDNRKHKKPDNDNKKPEEDITNYHKPLYSSVIEDVFEGEQNPIAQLTDKYKNLIFFAGTAMNKEINEENRVEEKIKNTLFIYHSGALKKTWGKIHFSTIDGFCRCDKPANKAYLIKNKIGAADGWADTPKIKFMGKNFAFDICLDFKTGVIDKKYGPLSAEKIKKGSVDVNVLIAGGMSIYDKNNKLKDYAMRASSNYILRCDASPDSTGCYCEIGDKTNNTNDIRHKLNILHLDEVDFHIGRGSVCVPDTDTQNICNI